jgi:anti-sigma-K factor RsiG
VAKLHDELDRLFAPDYLQGLHDRSLDELRAMRAECNHAETAVSYLRRVVQVRLDVVQGILAGAGSGDPDLSGVVEELPAIIGAGPPRPSGPGRLPARLAPDMDAVEADDLTADIDEVLDPGRIGELTSMSQAELRTISERLVGIEGRVSAQRRALHERIDALQAEIVSRYKSGDASPDGLLT